LRGAQVVQRFTEVSSALAQFIQQASILYSNHRLGGEIRDQVDLLVGEELNLSPAKPDCPNRDISSHQRDAKQRMEPPASCILAALGKFVGLGLQVSDMESLPVQDRSASDGLTYQRKRLDGN